MSLGPLARPVFHFQLPLSRCRDLESWKTFSVSWTASIALGYAACPGLAWPLLLSGEEEPVRKALSTLLGAGGMVLGLTLSGTGVQAQEVEPAIPSDEITGEAQSQAEQGRDRKEAKQEQWQERKTEESESWKEWKENHRDEWKNATPEQRQELKARHKAKRDDWRERQEAKQDQWQERKADKKADVKKRGGS